MKHNILVAAAMFGLTVLLFGATQADAQSATDDPAQVEAGKAVYETNCAGCHGEDGMGTERGRPLTDIASQEADRTVHIASVTDGKGPMPAFGGSLDAEEIDASISYVRLSFVSEPAAAEDDAAAESEEELAKTGTETPVVVVGGLTLVAAGALLVQASRKEMTPRLFPRDRGAKGGY